MPGGRRPPPRGVWSFEDRDVACPERVVLDTSFVVEALVPSQPLHARCRPYLVRLTDAATAIFFSRQLELELLEALFQLALKERHPRDWRRLRSDGRARARAGRLMTGAFARWRALVGAVASSRVEPEGVADLVPELMTSYGLASYDALHAATAIHTGVRRMVTTDTAFARLPEAELAVYTDGSRVAACRLMRA